MTEYLYQQEIRDCCKRLKQRALTTTGDTHQEYLYHVFKDELQLRATKRVRSYINTAGFPRPYDFSQFRDDEVEFQSDCSMESLQALEFYEQRKNIIMYGGTGTGKTMLSTTLSSFYKKLNKADVFILDEFGYVPYDRMGAQLLFDYLSEIHEHKLIILNTNLEFSRWVNVLYDEQMTSALIGRLTHHCHLILFPGGNNRLRESSLNETYHNIASRNHTEEDKY